MDTPNRSRRLAGDAVEQCIESPACPHGTTFLSRLSSSYPALGINPGLVASGFVSFSGGQTIVMAAGTDYSMAYENVYRNYADNNGFNDVEYGIATTGLSDGTDNGVSAWAYDHAGLGTTLFADPAGGLSFTQGINAGGAGLTVGGYFQGTLAEGWFNGLFDATSLTITPDVAAIPEPGMPALLLRRQGLVAVAARRGRKVTPAWRAAGVRADSGRTPSHCEGKLGIDLFRRAPWAALPRDLRLTPSTKTIDLGGCHGWPDAGPGWGCGLGHGHCHEAARRSRDDLPVRR